MAISTGKPCWGRPRAVFFLTSIVVCVGFLWFEQRAGQDRTVATENTENSLTNSQIHALLVAGSAGWGNYRHQADVAHAYHVLRGNDVPRENIVLMYYDDIANNTFNPHPGTIRNHPNGKDLYADLPKDYTHDEVNARNFLAVLRGNATLVSKNEHASGRVLTATEHDRVFVFYSDHGAPGLLGMPSGDYLYADQLMAAIQDRYVASGFKEMVLFIEACESGSMFDGILSPEEQLNVWATTASNPRESSWGVYCPGMAPAPPSEYTTCLGDLYSVAWMEYVEHMGNDLSSLSLRQLFENVRKRTNLSHVMEYGELEIEFEPASWYLGDSSAGGDHDVITQFDLSLSAVEQRDADLLHLQLTNKEAHAREHAARRKLDAHLRQTVAMVVENAGVNTRFDPSLPTSAWDWNCLRTLIMTYESARGRLSDYGMRYSPLFAGLCAHGVSPDQLQQAIVASEFEL